MNTSRPLRDVLDEQADRLAQDRQSVLDDAGHPGLPDALVAEAVVSYADTAPHQVAEHLAPFVTAHSAVRLGEPAGAEADLSHGLNLLATAPTDPDGPDPAEGGFDLDGLDAGGPAPAAEGGWPDAADAPDFGGGAGDEQHGRAEARSEVDDPLAPGEELPDLDEDVEGAFPAATGDHYLDLLDDPVPGTDGEPDGDDPAGL
jgi:hypothetical protein